MGIEEQQQLNLKPSTFIQVKKERRNLAQKKKGEKYKGRRNLAQKEKGEKYKGREKREYEAA